MNKTFAVVGWLLLAGTAAASPGEYRNPTAGRELALQVPGMHRAVVKRDVAYYARDGTALTLDVYRSHPRGVHGFDVRNHDAHSRQILRQAVAFARAHL